MKHSLLCRLAERGVHWLAINSRDVADYDRLMSRRDEEHSEWQQGVLRAPLIPLPVIPQWLQQIMLRCSLYSITYL